MSPGGFLGLVAITAVSVVGAAVVVATQRDFATISLSAGGPMLPVLTQRVDEVSQLVVDYPGYRLQLVRRNGTWLAGELGDFPVRANLASDLVASLAAMTRIEAKTDNPEWFGYIRVGGAERATAERGIRVSTFAGNGDMLADLVIGRASGSIGYSQLGGTFVRPAEQNQSWLVEGGVSIPATLPEWFGQLFTVPAVEIERVAILQGEQVLYEAARTDPQAADYVLSALAPEVGPETATADSDAIRGLNQAVVSVTPDNVRPRAGVAVPPEARRVRFTTRRGLQLEAIPVEIDGQTWMLFDATAPAGSEAAADAAAIAVRVENWAFLLPARRVTQLSTPPGELVILPAEAEPAAAPSQPPTDPAIPAVPGPALP